MSQDILIKLSNLVDFCIKNEERLKLSYNDKKKINLQLNNHNISDKNNNNSCNDGSSSSEESSDDCSSSSSSEDSSDDSSDDDENVVDGKNIVK